ncbi:hypothetical protein CLF_102602 [Clonorchis sinensis]|uniref:Uncharacterized protein n=2 Tax=Clonorchis sinensis TaxID=79923 RepID=G7Y874_CLOSI|nr:hypothetical protein CLF_102602 [Clonorchis sinensis]
MKSPADLVDSDFWAQYEKQRDLFLRLFKENKIHWTRIRDAERNIDSSELLYCVDSVIFE